MEPDGEYTRSSSKAINMTPDDSTTRTGRTYFQEHHPTLDSLPLYDTGNHLLNQYSQHEHNRCVRLGRQPPLYFVPSTSWWHEQARALLDKIIEDGHMLPHCKCLRSALIVLLNEHITTSLGGAIPRLPAQSSVTRHRRVRAIILSALTIEFVHWGLDQPHFQMAEHIRQIALTSHELATDTNRGHEPFANTAIHSAHKAIVYFSSTLSSRIKDLKMKRDRKSVV